MAATASSGYREFKRSDGYREDVLAVAARSQSQVPAEQLSNSTKKNMAVSGPAAQEPVVASIYQLDGIVRRAPALQMTADARQSSEVVAP